jgi:hypothetical protein
MQKGEEGRGRDKVSMSGCKFGDDAEFVSAGRWKGAGRIAGIGVMPAVVRVTRQVYGPVQRVVEVRTGCQDRQHHHQGRTRQRDETREERWLGATRNHGG